MFPRLALTAALVSAAAAQVEIFSPSASVWWVAQSINTLAWTCNDPAAAANPTFTVLLANSNPDILVAPLAIIGIQNNFDCSQTITADQVSAAAGTNYTILFSSVNNQTAVFATSEPFEIKALGATYPTTTPGAPSDTSSAAPPASTGTGANTSPSGTPSKPNGAPATGVRGLGLGLVLGAVGTAFGMML